MKVTKLIVLVALPSLGVGTAAVGQARGIPVYNNGVSTGLAVAAELGLPSGNAGGGIAYGASAELGLGTIGVNAMALRVNPKGAGATYTSLGAALDYKLFGGPLIPVSATLQAGIGHLNVGGGSDIRIPIGLGIGVSFPNPVLAIKPWIAPRVDIDRVSGGGSSSTKAHFAISGGVDFNLLSGIGAHVAYDLSRQSGVSAGTLGLGLHYGFRIPGL